MPPRRPCCGPSACCGPPAAAWSARPFSSAAAAAADVAAALEELEPLRLRYMTVEQLREFFNTLRAEGADNEGEPAFGAAGAAQLLDSVAEVGPNYTLLRSKETKAKRYGTKASKMSQKACLEFVAAPQPARAARTHRSRVLCTQWDPGSAQIQQE